MEKKAAGPLELEMLPRMKFSVITSATMQICVGLEALIGSSLAPSHEICEKLFVGLLHFYSSTHGKKTRAKFHYLVAGLGSIPTPE